MSETDTFSDLSKFLDIFKKSFLKLEAITVSKELKNKKAEDMFYYDKSLLDISNIIDEITTNKNVIEDPNSEIKEKKIIIELLEEVIHSLNLKIKNLIIDIDNQIKFYITQDRLNIGKSDDQLVIEHEISKLQKTGEISDKDIEKLKITSNIALTSYVLSILSTKKDSKHYPWLSDLPTKEELANKIELWKTSASGTRSEFYAYNFSVLCKYIYFLCKAVLRNADMLRISDITISKDSPSALKNVQKILLDLLFITVSNDLVPETYEDLKKGKYSNAQNQSKFETLLGSSNFSLFAKHIVKDGRHFENKKIVKIETLLKYVLLACSKLDDSRPDNVQAYMPFYSKVSELLEETLKKCKSIIDADAISFSEKDRLKASHNEKNSLFTFVKIRIDKNSSGIYEQNQRFRVTTDKNRQILMLGYDPVPKSIYSLPDLNLLPEFEYLEDKEEPMPCNFLFGPLSYIFQPKDDNKTISYSPAMRPLIDQIIRGDSVVKIGYGASGSGKTTALVFAAFEEDVQKQNGILVHFCNQVKTTYDRIVVSMIEFQGDITQLDEYKARDFFKVLPMPDNVRKNFNSQKSYTPEDLEIEKYYQDHYFSVSGDGEWKLDTDSTKVKHPEFTSNTLLGNFIVSVMDGKRNVKATTNNPVSSRSHMVIFLQFQDTTKLKQTKSPYLIICDFAGVENKFQCNVDDILNAFEKIKSKTKCKPEKLSDSGICEEYKGFYEDDINAAEKSVVIQDLGPNTKLPIPIVISDPIQCIVEGNKKFLGQLKAHPILPVPNNSVDAYKILISLNNMPDKNKDAYSLAPIMMMFGLAKTSAALKGDAEKIIKMKMSLGKYLGQQLIIISNSSAKNDSKKTILTKICKDRVKEGQFINDSLTSLRKFISFFVTNVQNTSETGILNPKFIDECAPIQANPNFEDFFGFSDYDISVDENSLKDVSVIVNKIREKICCNENPSVEPTGNCRNCADCMCDSFKKLTFSVFNVINLSKGKSFPLPNNPPPIPYVDVTDLVKELNRLQSINFMLTADADISDTSVDTQVYPPYLKDLRNSDLFNGPKIIPSQSKKSKISISKPAEIVYENTYGKIPGESTKIIFSMIDRLLQKADLSTNIERLKLLIDTINGVNSLSLVGTMEFTDLIAKFGLNRSVCNYKNSKSSNAGKVVQADVKIQEYKKFLIDLQRNIYKDSIV